MAFNLSAFGIPNYDTNVNVLYQHAVEHGESTVYEGGEYVMSPIAKTPVRLLLDFVYERDGETPKSVIAHTFLENAVRWPLARLQGAGDARTVQCGRARVHAELVNPQAAGEALMPMLYADRVEFSASKPIHAELALLAEQLVAKEEGVVLLSEVRSVQPVILSKLWIFSVVELALQEGSIFLPVARDTMERQLAECQVGSTCYVQGQLSLMKVQK
ncbi:MAG: hypothetical protein Q4C56_02835 [Peptococcaceae bacterium]|nr:hypothetical protein [Peptococcaceae bacterium]